MARSGMLSHLGLHPSRGASAESPFWIVNAVIKCPACFLDDPFKNGNIVFVFFFFFCLFVCVCGTFALRAEVWSLRRVVYLNLAALNVAHGEER